MDVLMPQLGETVAEGKITVWYKAVGDAVAAGDSLFEIETDKTSMEIPTTTAGVLAEIRAAAGVTVPVGAVVAVIRAAPAASVSVSSRIQITPRARRLAAQRGVSLDSLAGSGPGGRITGKDVDSATPKADTVVSAAGSDVKALFASVPFEELELDSMRRNIAQRLTAAKQNIPHFYLSLDVVMDRLLAVRAALNTEQDGLGLHLSITDFVVRAVALALQRVSEANVVWAGDRMLRFARSDVAVAVAVPGGLYTPVIRQAEIKSIRAVSRELKALIERARTGGLRPDDYRGGSISISNLGMYGVRAFSAIINPPHSATLAIGAVERRPAEGADGSLRFESRMTATLSCDHRVIDGALGARLLSAIQQLLQAPEPLLTASV